VRLASRSVYFLMSFLIFADYAYATARDSLPYKTYPLVQTGSPNIAPKIDKNLAGFRLKGDAVFREHEGKQTICLGPKSELHFSIDVKPNTLYGVSFQFIFTPDTVFDYSSAWPGIHGWIVASDREAKNVSTWRVLEQRKLSNWGLYQTHVFTTQSGNKLRMNLEFSGIGGCALIADIRVYTEDIPLTERRMVISPPEGKAGVTFGEVRRNEDSESLRNAAISSDTHQTSGRTAKEERDKPVIFHRADPDKLFSYSKPRSDEINQPIELALTQGEVGVTTLAVYSPKKLTKLRPIFSQLKSANGHAFQGTIEWKVIHYHPRRIRHDGQGRTWHWVADHFLNVSEGINAKENETSVFWIKVNANSEIISGIYKGNITIESAKGIIGFVPITVKIRPFRLVNISGRTRGLYPDFGRWKTFTDEQILRELNDFKDHGIDSIYVPCGYPLVDNNGKIAGWQFSEEDERYMSLILQAKIKGHFIARFNGIDNWITNHFKILSEELKSDPNLWPENIKEAYKQCLLLFKKEFERRGWSQVAFQAIDEPNNSNARKAKHFIWKYKTAIEAGLKTYSTSSYLPDDPLGQNLSYHAYGGAVLVNEQRTSLVREETHKAGQRFWYYATGAYSGQIGNMVRNRYLSGFLFFRSRADGLMSWTFQRPSGDPFDDFYASKSGQACITYPDKDHPGENLDTPQWEGLRQGWIDFWYISTLADIAKQSATAAKELERILNSMPWNGDVFRDDGVTNAKCDKWREEIAEAIERFTQ
jgi:hypothetical protein